MRRIYSHAASDFSLNVVTSLMQANQCFGQSTISDHPIKKIKCSRDSVHIAIIVIPINFNPVKPLHLSWLHSLSCIPYRISSHNATTAMVLTRGMLWPWHDRKSLLSHICCYTLFLCSLNWWVHNIPYRNTLIWSPRVVQLIILRPIVLQHRCWDTMLTLLVSPTADPD